MIRKYDTSFDTDDPVAVELDCIRMGGRWKVGGQDRGLGIVAHHKAFQKLILPNKQWHRWNELILPYLADPYYRLVGLAGKGSSGKTHEAACAAVATWCARPNETTILVSSTDMRSLELRVWGEIKKVWSAARSVSDNIPGRLIGSKQVIISETEDETAEDFRNGILAVPCLVGGSFVGLGKYCMYFNTPVDTPFGPIPIQKIIPGDIVYSASGNSTVEAISSRIVTHLVRVTFSNGKYVDCTPDHPFLTTEGWVNSVDLLPSHILLSHCETLSILQEADSELSPPSEILFGKMRNGELHEKLQAMRRSVCSQGCASDFLLSLLRSEMENDATGYCIQDGCWEKFRGSWQEDQQGNHGISNREGKKKAVSEICFVSLQSQMGRRWSCDSNEMGINRFRNVPNGSIWIRHQDREEFENWRCFLQARRVLAGIETGRGNRWPIPQPSESQSRRYRSDSIPETPRVDRVEVLKPGHKISPSKSDGGYRVYNLEVAGHPSYSVNGCIVHNCGIKNRHILLIADEASLMSDAYSKGITSLEQNPGFRCWALANPKDRFDVFGKIVEPADSEGGWAVTEDINKTTVWKTRKDRGVCINLVGTDSPNHDEPKNRFAGWMPSVEDVNASLAYYGKDSAMALMFVLGVFPKDAQSRRVISRALCAKFSAQEDVVWEIGPSFKVVAIDAAYGAVGGDRTPLIELHVGKCHDGKQRVAVANVLLIPVRASLPELPEDQIALFTKKYCEDRDIPPSNVGFDSTGRGSLMSSFCRLWSTAVIGVEFGGVASDRPAFDNKTGPNTNDAPKTCRQTYVNFCTELAFLLHTIVTSDQMRMLPTEVMEEAASRSWDFVGSGASGTRIQVEPKVELKLRLGRSPDFADSLAVGLELCRRLGLVIGGAPSRNQDLDKVLREFAEQRKKQIRERELTY